MFSEEVVLCANVTLDGVVLSAAGSSTRFDRNLNERTSEWEGDKTHWPKTGGWRDWLRWLVLKDYQRSARITSNFDSALGQSMITRYYKREESRQLFRCFCTAKTKSTRSLGCTKALKKLPDSYPRFSLFSDAITFQPHAVFRKLPLLVTFFRRLFYQNYLFVSSWLQIILQAEIVLKCWLLEDEFDAPQFTQNITITLFQLQSYFTGRKMWRSAH